MPEEERDRRAERRNARERETRQSQDDEEREVNNSARREARAAARAALPEEERDRQAERRNARERETRQSQDDEEREVNNSARREARAAARAALPEEERYRQAEWRQAEWTNARERQTRLSQDDCAQINANRMEIRQSQDAAVREEVEDGLIRNDNNNNDNDFYIYANIAGEDVITPLDSQDMRNMFPSPHYENQDFENVFEEDIRNMFPSPHNEYQDFENVFEEAVDYINNSLDNDSNSDYTGEYDLNDNIDEYDAENGNFFNIQYDNNDEEENDGDGLNNNNDIDEEVNDDGDEDNANHVDAYHTTNIARVHAIDDFHEEYISPFSIGLMTNSCTWCQAKFFDKEKNSRGKYTICCGGGANRIPHLEKPPPFINSMFMGEEVNPIPEGMHLNDCKRHQAEFLKHSMLFNTSVAFTSITSNRVDTMDRSTRNGGSVHGLPYLRLNGAIYQNIGPMFPNSEDEHRGAFLQCYFYSEHGDNPAHAHLTVYQKGIVNHILNA